MDIDKIAKTLLKPRPKTAHKKSVGRVLIIAGSKGMTGAAVLCAKACMRAGAGYVALAFPESLDQIYKELIPEVVTYPLPERKNSIDAKKSLKLILLKEIEYDVLVVGPGISRKKEVIVFVNELIKKSKRPLVLDADALFGLEKNTGILKNREPLTVLTPHEGEMSRLLSVDIDYVYKHREEITKETATKNQAYIILKGHNTVVVSKEGKAYQDKIGGPELATAGTGDVLAGIVGALLAENLKRPFEAISLAVYIHSLSGKLAREKLGERSVMASDIIQNLPIVIQKLH